MSNEFSSASNKLVFPELFHIGRFSLPTYGLLVATGVLLGLWISVRNSEKQGIDPEKAWNLGILVVLAGILGAKILYILVDWNTYASNPSEIFSLNTLRAGGVFSGGLLAALAAAIWYIRKHSMPALATCDAFAPGLELGHAIGRVGCFAAGCCWGKETHHFWGVVFTNPLAQELVGTPLGHALQPTQLFESAVELANFFLLTWLLARKKFDGQVIGAYLFLYGIARFFLEFLRGDPGRGEVFGGALSGTQLISIGLVIAGGLIWWLKSGVAKTVPAQATR
ncbi:MAG: prolipoprotein diacylglyceryl transferase [Acidobacteria bacterium]|nr:MAG: prolipoprotein diacylglyceryl transferase [Acidobacteriota bacterium]